MEWIVKKTDGHIIVDKDGKRIEIKRGYSGNEVVVEEDGRILFKGKWGDVVRFLEDCLSEVTLSLAAGYI